MTKGRDNEAERLRDVLDLIRMRRQSGVLSMEHYQGNSYEEGEVAFQDGQPTYAQTGNLAGQEALRYLLGWHQIYFRFINDQTHFSTSHSAPTPANTSVPTAIGTPIIPTTPRTSQVNTTGNVPAISTRLPQANMNGISTKAGTNDTMYGPTNLNPNTPGLEWLVPRKQGQQQDVLSLPLTRPQRSIYLLVDGRRTVADLARCTRKSLQEVERLLIELQDRGLIAV